ncbi:hypothetical protein C8R45DRAFT_1084037 [Mycena sanguinolenta]|nr:hypothetical protein C8R45DRAFT_1084037 [Mycena sanguinolenta]
MGTGERSKLKELASRITDQWRMIVDQTLVLGTGAQPTGIGFASGSQFTDQSDTLCPNPVLNTFTIKTVAIILLPPSSIIAVKIKISNNQSASKMPTCSHSLFVSYHHGSPPDSSDKEDAPHPPEQRLDKGKAKAREQQEDEEMSPKGAKRARKVKPALNTVIDQSNRLRRKVDVA